MEWVEPGGVKLIKTITSTLEAAQEYLSRGWQPLPIPHGAKAPVIKDWQHIRFKSTSVSQHFADGNNIGLLCGEPSNGLVDIDLDCNEAIAGAQVFLPQTGLVHGRQSKLRSHYWYITKPILETKRFTDPDGTCMVEIRSTGGQTIVPPSTHPSGEIIAWQEFSEPTVIEGLSLKEAVSCVASCALLARYWPNQGSRHYATLATAGFLLRGGLAEDLVEAIIGTAARIAGDEEWAQRVANVKHTAEQLARGEKAIGGPTLSSLIHDGEEIVKKIGDWLGLGNQTTTVWEPPLPFIAYEGPAFPVDALPEPVRYYAEAQALALQVPIDLIACLVLGVGSAAAAGRCVVHLKDGWAEPLNLFIVVALPSGDRKSPAFREVKEPLEDRERDLVHALEPEVAIHQAERDIMETRLRMVKTKAAEAKPEDMDQMMGEVHLLAVRLSAKIPNLPRLLADDATPESVASLLARHGGRMAVMSSEGGLFETLAGRYSDHIPNLDVFLKGYSGDTIRVDRKSRAPEFVAKPAITLCLTVQPSVIQDLASKRTFRGRGLLARFQWSIPKSLMGYRSNTAPPVPDKLHSEWYNAVMTILKLPDPADGEEHALRLSLEAHTIFLKFRDDVESRLRPGAELREIGDWGNKLAGNVARFAGILHLFRHAEAGNPWDIPIEHDTMKAAVLCYSYVKRC